MNEVIPCAAIFTLWDYSDHAGPITVVNRDLRSWNNSRSGVDLPKWKEIIAAGGDATTSFDGTKSDVFPVFGMATVNWHNSATPHVHFTARSYGLLLPVAIPAINTSDWTTANNKALAQVYQRARELRTSVQGLSILGELRDTVRMLKSPMKSIIREVERWSSDTLKNRKRIAAKIGRLRRSHAPLKEIASSLHLEVVFGWMPFFRDIQDVAAAAKDLYQDFPRIVVTGHGSVERNSLASRFYDTRNNYIKSIVNEQDYTVTSVRYKVGFDCNSIETDQVKHGLERFGITTNEIAPAIWECTVFSFLADYFGNINAIVDALSVSMVGQRWACRNDVYQTTRTRAATLDHKSIKTALSDKYEGSFGDLGRTVAITRRVARRKVTAMPIPSFELKVPGLDEVKKLANIAALACQRANRIAKVTVFE